jgi:hypothetical protein
MASKLVDLLEFDLTARGFAPIGLQPVGCAYAPEGMLESFHAAYQKNGRKKHRDSNKL